MQKIKSTKIPQEIENEKLCKQNFAVVGRDWGICVAMCVFAMYSKGWWRYRKCRTAQSEWLGQKGKSRVKQRKVNKNDVEQN